MIIVKIQGGLGNQMFQYAAAMALAELRGTSLAIDVHGYRPRSPRRYELNEVFGIDARVAPKRLCRSHHGEPRTLSARVLNKIGLWRVRRSPSYVVENGPGYFKGFRDLADGTYLAGYWQSESYFESITEKVRAAFTFQPTLGNNLIRRVEEITSCNAVSIHVRRTDYVTIERGYFLESLQPGYYDSAMAHVAERVIDPVFLVFSDDTVWARKRFASVPYICRVMEENDPENGAADMYLMSLCKHHIIANSTFSWWAAWLGARTPRLVIAPVRFSPAEHAIDRYPPQWVVM